MDEQQRQRRTETQRRYRERHREELAERARAKRQAHGDEIRAREAAYREAHREELRAGRAAWEERTYPARREELNAYQRERAKADPERRREYQRRFWEKQPPSRHFARHADRDARGYGNDERLDWENLNEGPCAYCGAEERVTWDHVIPLSRGGRNHSSNLVRCCLSCNRLKGSMTPEEWTDPDRRFRVLQRRRESSRRLLAERRAQYNAARRAKRAKARE